MLSVARPTLRLGLACSRARTQSQGYDATGRRLALGHAYAKGVVTPTATSRGPNDTCHPPLPPGLYGGRYRGSVSACYPLELVRYPKPQQHVAMVFLVVVVVRGSRARFHLR